MKKVCYRVFFIWYMLDASNPSTFWWKFGSEGRFKTGVDKVALG